MGDNEIVQYLKQAHQLRKTNKKIPSKEFSGYKFTASFLVEDKKKPIRRGILEEADFGGYGFFGGHIRVSVNTVDVESLCGFDMNKEVWLSFDLNQEMILRCEVVSIEIPTAQKETVSIGMVMEGIYGDDDKEEG